MGPAHVRGSHHIKPNPLSHARERGLRFNRKKWKKKIDVSWLSHDGVKEKEQRKIEKNSFHVVAYISLYTNITYSNDFQKASMTHIHGVKVSCYVQCE